MKKRLISMLMAVLMIASLLPAAAVFAGAEEAAPDTHEHKYTTVSIKKDAEKKTPGVEYKVCKECGKHFQKNSKRAYCSNKCAAEARRKQTAARVRKHREKKRQ